MFSGNRFADKSIFEKIFGKNFVREKLFSGNVPGFIAKLSIDHQMEKAKLNQKIEKLNCMVGEKTQENYNLKKRVHELTIKTNMLQEEKCTIRTDQNVRASTCISVHISICQYLLIRHSTSIYFISRKTK